MRASPSFLTGVMLMIAAMACFAVMNTAIGWLGAGMASMQMVFLRNLLSLLFIVMWMAACSRGLPDLRTARLTGHFWRASIGFCAMEIWFYALTILPLTLATALSFTTPIFVTVFAMLFLGEHAGLRRWAAIFMGFAGVLVILRPGVSDLHLSASVVLASSAIMALAAIVVKSLTRTEAPELIVFYMALFMTPLSLPLALPAWQPVSPPQWAALALIALSSTAAHLLLTRAYRHAEMAALMPFDFTRLLFTAALAYLFFGETLDAYTLLGAAIILASAVYIVHREAVHRGKGTG